MTSRIDEIGVAVSLVLMLVVLELVRRRKLTEEYSVVWMICAGGLLAISLRRDLLDRTAGWLGLYYPPSLLLLVMLVLGFVGSLCFSVALSRQRGQIERLTEDTVLLAAELRELRAELERQAVHVIEAPDISQETMIANPTRYTSKSGGH